MATKIEVKRPLDKTKLPPQNVDAEQSCLGSLLIDKDAIVKIADDLKPGHFYRDSHADIYRAILSLYEKRLPPDLVTVTDELKRVDKFELIGGSGYLTTLVNTVPTSAHVEHYAQIVKEAATKRALISAASGMQASNLLILAARPSVGKTTLAMNIAQHTAVREKIPIGIFSLEMSKEQLVDLLLAAESDVEAWKITTGNLDEKDFESISEAMGELAEAPLYIDDAPGISIMEMRTKARRLQIEAGLKLLIVDYLQLVRGRNLENRVQEVSEISQ